MRTPEIIDISPLLSPSIAVYPGDSKLTREWVCQLSNGDAVNLSTIRTTVHVGAHLDAPNHYGDSGAGIDSFDLQLGIGHCQVIHVEAKPGTRIGLDDIAVNIESERVLIGTGSYPNPDDYSDQFCALEPALIDHLAAAGVRLVGIDTPSIDDAFSKDLPAHKAVLRHDMRILEGIVLSAVKAGFYGLIALPLRLRGFDGSPVRAVLRSL